MPPRPECYALLEFLGDKLEPAELISLIPIPPWKRRRKGEQMGRASTQGMLAFARTGYCSFSTKGIEASLDMNIHVALLLSFVKKQAPAIKEIVHSKALKSQIVCFFSSRKQRSDWSLNNSNQIGSKELGIEVLPEMTTKDVQIEIEDRFISR